MITLHLMSPADTYRFMLSQNLGAAFVPSPAVGTLMPFGEEVLDVTAFCDMWGDYTDTLTIKVKNIHLTFSFNKTTVR